MDLGYGEDGACEGMEGTLSLGAIGACRPLRIEKSSALSSQKAMEENRHVNGRSTRGCRSADS